MKNLAEEEVPDVKHEMNEKKNNKRNRYEVYVILCMWVSVPSFPMNVQKKNKKI